MVSLSSGLHDNIALDACSESDGEKMFGLDGEEKWFADFEKEHGVEIKVPFGGRFTFVEGTYDGAVANQQICKQNLDVFQKVLKNRTMHVGKYFYFYLPIRQCCITSPTVLFVIIIWSNYMCRP